MPRRPQPQALLQVVVELADGDAGHGRCADYSPRLHCNQCNQFRGDAGARRYRASSIDQPRQQQRDRPQRRRGPAVAPRLGAADLRDRLRRQHQAIAGDGIELLRQPRRADRSPGMPPRKRPTSTVPSAASSIRPMGPRLQLDPPPRLGDRPHVELGIERAGHAFHHDHGLLQQQLRWCACRTGR